MKLLFRTLCAAYCLFCFSSCSEQPRLRSAGTTYAFIGSYTNGIPGEGIYVYHMDTGTGRLTKVSSVQQVTNPSFINLSPDGGHLYACTETRMHDAGSVSAFSFDSLSGQLSFINKQPSGGENPVYLTVSRNNKWLVMANYTGGSISVFPIKPNGSLKAYSQLLQFTDSSINEYRQDSSHIHSVLFAPNQDFLFAPDLGADKIRIYRFDSLNAKPLQPANLSFIKAAPGSGPRHFTFHPNGRFAYCVEELSGTVAAYTYNNGQLEPIQRIASYAQKQEDYGSADIHISPDGRFLYASNREEEHSISIFSINAATGLLTLIGHQSTLGKHPRMFAIDPNGRFLLVANQFGNNVVVFRRDTRTGLLTYTGFQIKVPNPSCLQIRTYGK